MRLTRIGVAAALVAVGVSSVAGPAAAAPATEPSTLRCESSVPIYRVTPTGEMLRYQHNEPEAGTANWTSQPRALGTGWQDGRSVAGPDGVVYAAWEDGALRRYRYNGTGWDTFNGSGHQVIDTTGGWARYLTPEYKNRITVDSDGFIYTIEPDERLHQRFYNPTTREWTHRVLASGWNQFNLIVAAGPGVIYARKPSGELFRHRFHTASQRWLQTGFAVGAGWQMFDRVFSPGGDILYGIRNDHVGHDNEMLWYRFNEDTDTWASATGQVIGSGWVDWNTHAEPDTCLRVGTTVPIRPQVTPREHAPATLMLSSSDSVHYSYVDSNSRAVHIEITDLVGGTPAGAAVVPGMTGVTGQSGIGEYPDGTVQVIARRTDSEILTSTRSGTGGPWLGTATLGGFLNAPASAVRLADNRLVLYGADGTGQVWYRSQSVVNGVVSGGWTKVFLAQACRPDPCSFPVFDDNQISAVGTASGNFARLIARDRDGRYWTHTHNIDADISAGGRWRSLGTQRFVGPASVVVMPDDTRQVFATGTDGVVYTQRETSGGFPGTWTAIPGVTASGRPSAIMDSAGILQVVVRATDGYVYFTGQQGPGTGTFNPWREITDFTEQSSTDPTALSVPASRTWVVAYRTIDDVPRLGRHTPSAPARFPALAMELS